MAKSIILIIILLMTVGATVAQEPPLPDFPEYRLDISPLLDRDVCVRDGVPMVMSYDTQLNTFLYLNQRGDVVLLQVGKDTYGDGSWKIIDYTKIASGTC